MSLPPRDQHDVLKGAETAQGHVLIAHARKTPKRIILALLIMGVAVIGIWCSYQDADEAGDAVDDRSEQSDLTIAGRVAVPALTLAADAVVETTPTPAPIEEEIAAFDSDPGLHDARLKSAIIAQDATEHSADATAEISELDPTTEREPADAQAQFVQSVTGKGVPNSVASQVQGLAYKVLQGKMIEAVLESRARSDLPGMVCATVSRDVYGAKARIKLVPWGARICGQYSAEVRTGQERLFVVWNSLRRPDGVEVALDSPGADQLGTAGMGGLVDTHFAKIFGVSALLSIIGAGSGSRHTAAQHAHQVGAYYRESVQSAASQTAQQLLQPYINLKPTITVPAGARIRIYVNRDVDFSAMYPRQGHEKVQGDVMIYD